MAESMITRVARILEPQAWAALGTGDTLAYKNRRTSSLRKARAAIETMKEPTDEMIVAGYNAADLWNASAHPMSNVIMRAKATYEGMLNAALAETKEEPHG